MTSEKGPHSLDASRRSEAREPSALEALGWLRDDDEARIRRIEAELREGFATLRDVEPAVAFFGSARTPEDQRPMDWRERSPAPWRTPDSTS